VGEGGGGGRRTFGGVIGGGWPSVPPVPAETPYAIMGFMHCNKTIDHFIGTRFPSEMIAVSRSSKSAIISGVTCLIRVDHVCPSRYAWAQHLCSNSRPKPCAK